MTKSYPTRGTSVKQAGSSSETSAAAPPFDRSASRTTATFVLYYWEAYNEIAEPRRFDHYLINRWMPDLGPLGFCIIKAIRDKCYYNPASGILRDECELTMQELADQLRVSRATLFREFERNEALSHFVKREGQVQRLGGKLVQAENIFKVCMDDPIHWDDMERYDRLRAERELARMQPPQEISRRRIKGEKTSPKSESQFETLTSSTPVSESQIETAGESQIETPLVSQIETAIKEDLPSGILTKESLTPGGGVSPINPPRGTATTELWAGKAEDAGDRSPSLDPLHSSWNAALALLREIVNTATLNAHLKPMRLVSIEGDIAVLVAQTAFAKTWIEGRHRAEVEAALSEVLGKPVTVQITAGGK